MDAVSRAEDFLGLRQINKTSNDDSLDIPSCSDVNRRFAAYNLVAQPSWGSIYWEGKSNFNGHDVFILVAKDYKSKICYSMDDLEDSFTELQSKHDRIKADIIERIDGDVGRLAEEGSMALQQYSSMTEMQLPGSRDANKLLEEIMPTYLSLHAIVLLQHLSNVRMQQGSAMSHLTREIDFEIQRLGKDWHHVLDRAYSQFQHGRHHVLNAKKSLAQMLHTYHYRDQISCNQLRKAEIGVGNSWALREKFLIPPCVLRLDVAQLCWAWLTSHVDENGSLEKCWSSLPQKQIKLWVESIPTLLQRLLDDL